jgi:hypothetical protein
MKRIFIIATPIIAFVMLISWKTNTTTTTEPVNKTVVRLQNDADFNAYAENQLGIVKETYTAFKENAKVKALAFELKTASPERKNVIGKEIAQLSGVYEQVNQAAGLFKKLDEKLKNEYQVENKEKDALLKQAFNAKLVAAQKGNQQGCIGEVVALANAAGQSYGSCINSGGPFLVCYTMMLGQLFGGLAEIEQNNPGCIEMLFNALY